MEALCERMLFEMKLRNFSPHTIKAYTSHLRRFGELFHRSPLRMGEEHVRNYLFDLRERQKVSWSNIHIAATALKFFYRVTLRRAFDVTEIPHPKDEYKLPIILSFNEVLQLLNAAASLKNKVILMATYGAGLRLSEVANLQIADIDRARMLIRVRQGKGRRDRYTLLPLRLLRTIDAYVRTHRPSTWLFPGKVPDRPLATRSIQHIFHLAKKKRVSRRKFLCIRCVIVLPPILWKVELIFLSFKNFSATPI